MLHPIPAGLLIAFEQRAERTHLHLIGPAPHIAAADEGVKSRQLSHQLSYDIVQLLAVGDPIYPWNIFLAHGNPIDSMHVSVIEIIALHPPGVDEQFTKLIAWFERETPFAQIHTSICQRFRNSKRSPFCIRVKDIELLAAPDEHLFPILR